MEMLDKVLAMIMSANGMAATVAVVLEFVLRLVPSEKPLSLLRVVVAVLRKVSSVLVALCDLSDKVLPQNIK